MSGIRSQAGDATVSTLGVRRSDDLRRGGRYLAAFWRRAYEENITGLAAMVAYNLFLACSRSLSWSCSCSGGSSRARAWRRA